jgi:hypothetical protein
MSQFIYSKIDIKKQGRRKISPSPPAELGDAAVQPKCRLAPRAGESARANPIMPQSIPGATRFLEVPKWINPGAGNSYGTKWEAKPSSNAPTAMR